MIPNFWKISPSTKSTSKLSVLAVVNTFTNFDMTSLNLCKLSPGEIPIIKIKIKLN